MSIFDKVKNFIDNSDEDTIDEISKTSMTILPMTHTHPTAPIPGSLSGISAQPQDRLLRLRCPI